MSIIAEALKKAQEKRTQNFEDTSSKLEKILLEESPLIPKKFSKPSSSQKKGIFTTPLDNSSSERLRFKENLLRGFVLFLFFSVIFMSYPLLRGNFASRENSDIELGNVSLPGGNTVRDESSYARPRQTRLMKENVRLADSYSQSSALKLPVLSGIMYSSYQPQAVIDGMLISEGDTVGNFLVVRILREKVVISNKEEKYEINLR